MCQVYFFQLNKDKTEIIVFGSEEDWLKVSAQLQSVMLKTTDQARNLPGIMDSDLNFRHLQSQPTITLRIYPG